MIVPLLTLSSAGRHAEALRGHLSSALRAVAAAWRICIPPFWIEKLPIVGPWSGVSAVSPWTIVDPVDRQVELFGCNLRQRSSHAGAKIDFAGIDGDLSVSADRKKSVDFINRHRLCGRCSQRIGARDAAGKPEGDDERASQEVAASADRYRARAPPPQPLRAARCTARIIRRCVPQRQRLSASAFLISATLGFFFFASSATV